MKTDISLNSGEAAFHKHLCADFLLGAAEGTITQGQESPGNGGKWKHSCKPWGPQNRGYYKKPSPQQDLPGARNTQRTHTQKMAWCLCHQLIHCHHMVSTHEELMNRFYLLFLGVCENIWVLLSANVNYAMRGYRL